MRELPPPLGGRRQLLQSLEMWLKTWIWNFRLRRYWNSCRMTSRERGNLVEKPTFALYERSSANDPGKCQRPCRSWQCCTKVNCVHHSSSSAAKHARSLLPRLGLRRAANISRLDRYLCSQTCEATLMFGREMRDVGNVLEDDQNVNNMAHEYLTGYHAKSSSPLDGGQNMKCGANS